MDRELQGNPHRPAELILIERDEGAFEGYIATAQGEVRIMVSFCRFDDVLVFDRVHVTGRGLTTTIIREAARDFARREGAVRVLIQGGQRRSGAKPGTIPTTIIVEAAL